MCFECRVLGALLVGHTTQETAKATGLEDVLSIGASADSGNESKPAISTLDFCPTVLEIEDKELRDYLAEEYLKDTLTLLAEQFGVELVPITVDSDGSCLPHAISRCLVGKEILYDTLRKALAEELRENEEFYKSVFQQGMDDGTFASYWESVCEEAKPTHSAKSDRWLGPEHIFGFSNLLKRPILVLDILEEMQKDDHRCGLYLPLRHKRSDCVDENGNMSCPLVIGWAGEEKDHFVSLIVPTRHALLASEDNTVSDRVLAASPALWESIEQLLQARENASECSQIVSVDIPLSKKPGDVCVLRDPKTGEEFYCEIPPDKGPGESFEWRVPGPLNKALTKLKRAAIHFYGLNPPVLRHKTCATMFKLLSNLVDAVLLGDMEKLAKVEKFPLDNKAIQTNLVASHGALALLQAAGFEQWEDPQTKRQYMRFTGDFSKPITCDILVIARDIVGLLRTSDDFALGGGQIPFKRAGEVFGPVPLFLSEWAQGEEYARAQDAEVWLFGMGNQLRLSRLDELKSLVGHLKQCFDTLSDGTDFAKFPWEDLFQYNSRLNEIKCPRCSRSQSEFGPCEDCGNELDKQHTGQTRMSQFVRDLFTEGKLRLCESHSLLFRNDQACPKCTSRAI